MDLNNFNYGIPMKEYEYTRILLSSMHQETINQYELTYIKDNGWIYTRIKNRMPGLKQAGKNPNNRLKNISQNLIINQ